MENNELKHFVWKSKEKRGRIAVWAEMAWDLRLKVHIERLSGPQPPAAILPELSKIFEIPKLPVRTDDDRRFFLERRKSQFGFIFIIRELINESTMNMPFVDLLHISLSSTLEGHSEISFRWWHCIIDAIENEFRETEVREVPIPNISQMTPLHKIEKYIEPKIEFKFLKPSAEE